MIAIREEIRGVETGTANRDQNVLNMSPHTMQDVVDDAWDRPYSREQAAFPTPDTRESKLWPAVGRIDAAHGDRHLMCTCPPMEEYEEVAHPVG